MSNWGTEPLDIYERAFGIIANASNGDWSKESEEWQEAAAEFRKDYHHALDKHSWKTERELLEQEINELRETIRKLKDVPSCVTNDILTEIYNERMRQDEKWGGPKHDDTHNEHEWNNYRYIREEDVLYTFGDVTTRSKLIEIAALAVAQIEAFDRKFKNDPLCAMTKD